MLKDEINIDEQMLVLYGNNEYATLGIGHDTKSKLRQKRQQRN